MANYCGFKGIAILSDDGFEQLIKMQGQFGKDKDHSGFSTLDCLLGFNNHAFDEEFNLPTDRPYLLINHEHNALRFCTSFNAAHRQQFLKDLSQCATALIMQSLDEGGCTITDSKTLYMRSAERLLEIFPQESEELLKDAEVRDGVYTYRIVEPIFGCDGSEGWELVENEYFKPKEDAPLKKFLLKWDERVEDDGGYLLHYQQKTQIIEAQNEDAAADQWEKENEYNEYQNGLDSIEEVVEHPLLKKILLINMPDGLTYGVPVNFIARNRAERLAKELFNGDTIQSLIQDTLPFFEADEQNIRDWATQEISWDTVKNIAQPLQRKISADEYQAAWQQGESKII